MLINEVCKECNLTKKAIAYYEQQGFISPQLLENGYRDFNQDDLVKLKKIAVLRHLDLTIESIKKILNSSEIQILKDLSLQKELELNTAKEKQRLLEQLSNGADWNEISQKIDAIERNQSIAQKLLMNFPGYYGRFLSLHFSSFLNEPINTQEQQEAFEKIVEFLDQIQSFDIPKDLQEYFDAATNHLGSNEIKESSQAVQHMLEDPKQYLKENRDAINYYIAYKNTQEYKQSPACKLQTLLKKLNETSGYYNIFIPAMKQLSPSYKEYAEKLQAANQKFLLEHPEVKEWDE